MKTEIIRHICDAGVLDKEGTKFAHPNVIAEAKRTRPFRVILGSEKKNVSIGTVSLNDYQSINGKRFKLKTRAPQEHLDVGIPPGLLITCRKITTVSGPLFRDSGFYIKIGQASHIESNLQVQ